MKQQHAKWFIVLSNKPGTSPSAQHPASSRIVRLILFLQLLVPWVPLLSSGPWTVIKGSLSPLESPFFTPLQSRITSGHLIGSLRCYLQPVSPRQTAPLLILDSMEGCNITSDWGFNRLVDTMARYWGRVSCRWGGSASVSQRRTLFTLP